jgi:hypothetical protein
VANLWLFLEFSWLFWLFLASNLAIFSNFNLATLSEISVQFIILNSQSEEK